MASDLKAKTLSGMIWSFIQRFGTMIISFVSNIVLARLLTPDDYGTIGMLMIFIAVANTFVDGGFGSALIQKKEPTQADYSTIFWWNMFLSLVLYGVLYVCAPAVARFYDLPLLSRVLRVQGFVLILNALSIIQQNQLRKQLKFKRLASVTVVSAVLSSGIAIVLAYKGWGVWALVAQQLMLSGFTAIILWVTNKWYPSLIFSKKSFKELFGFGGFILLSNLINTLCDNIQGLLLGKFFNPATLGYYTQARKLEEVATSSVSGVINQVAYPVLSVFQQDINGLIRALKRFIQSIAFIVFPLMFLLIVIAKPTIILLYSDKWLMSVPYFQILCVAGLAISLQMINYNAIAAVGKSDVLFKWTIIKRGLGLIFNIGGLVMYGVYGLLIGGVLTAYTLYFINSYLVAKHIGYKISQQLKDLFPILLSALIAFTLTLFYNNNVHFTSSNIIILLSDIVIYGICYLIISVFLNKEIVTEVRCLFLKIIH